MLRYKALAKYSIVHMSRFALLFLLVIAGCAALVPLPRDHSLEKKVLLPFRVNSIVIDDRRSDTTSIKLEMPAMLTKADEWSKSPALTHELAAEIKSLIHASSNAEGLPVEVTLSINKGYYRIKGNAWEVSEQTYFECRINYVLRESNVSLAVGSNAISDYTGVFNATEKHVAESYKITVRNAIFRALKESEKILDAEIEIENNTFKKTRYIPKRSATAHTFDL